MSETRTKWLEGPLSIELTTADVMADLDDAWATWEPGAKQDLLDLPA